MDLYSQEEQEVIMIISKGMGLLYDGKYNEANCFDHNVINIYPPDTAGAIDQLLQNDFCGWISLFLLETIRTQSDLLMSMPIDLQCRIMGNRRTQTV